jgi:hypothetical protein
MGVAMGVVMVLAVLAMGVVMVLAVLVMGVVMVHLSNLH